MIYIIQAQSSNTHNVKNVYDFDNGILPSNPTMCHRQNNLENFLTACLKTVEYSAAF